MGQVEGVRHDQDHRRCVVWQGRCTSLLPLQQAERLCARVHQAWLPQDERQCEPGNTGVLVSDAADAVSLRTTDVARKIQKTRSEKRASIGVAGMVDDISQQSDSGGPTSGGTASQMMQDTTGPSMAPDIQNPNTTGADAVWCSSHVTNWMTNARMVEQPTTTYDCQWAFADNRMDHPRDAQWSDALTFEQVTEQLNQQQQTSATVWLRIPSGEMSAIKEFTSANAAVAYLSRFQQTNQEDTVENRILKSLPPDDAEMHEIVQRALRQKLALGHLAKDPQTNGRWMWADTGFLPSTTPWFTNIMQWTTWAQWNPKQ